MTISYVCAAANANTVVPKHPVTAIRLLQGAGATKSKAQVVGCRATPVLGGCPRNKMQADHQHKRNSTTGSKALCWEAVIECIPLVM
jgi:hypothetical protein